MEWRCFCSPVISDFSLIYCDVRVGQRDDFVFAELLIYQKCECPAVLAIITKFVLVIITLLKY